MAGLEPLRIVKNWTRDTSTREENWDAIANPVTSFSVQSLNNFKQLGLDVGGADYNFNGVGRSTQTIPVTTRLTTLENQGAFISSRNLGLKLTDTTKIVLCGADGENLSSTNVGLASFNSTANIGRVITREITSNLSVTLTGAHWGLDTFGDKTDYVLWIYLIDNGTDAVLGVGAQAGRATVTTADDETAASNCTTVSKVLVSSALSGTYNCIIIGWVNADFDDTGNAGGENFWTVQSAVGDVNFQQTPPRVYGVIEF